jgi:hypothetical protein
MVAMKTQGAKRFQSTNLILNTGQGACAAALTDAPVGRFSSISVAKERFPRLLGAA